MMITIVRADVNLGKVDFEVAPERNNYKTIKHNQVVKHRFPGSTGAGAFYYQRRRNVKTSYTAAFFACCRAALSRVY